MPNLILRVAALVLLACLSGTSMAQEACARLLDLQLDHAKVESAREEPSVDFPAAGPRLAAHTQAHCAVRVVATPTADSRIHMELWLPPPAVWNGKYLQKGSGGWGGDVYTYALVTPLNRGYAAAVTDDGHTGDGTAKFTVGHPEKLIDFGYRAIHETSRLSRQLIVAYYGTAQKKAYFVGCSDGGREALMQAQRYPADFDGIVAGAPAARWTHITASFVWNERALAADGKPILPVAKLDVLQAAVLRRCDTMDGLDDGIVDDPRRCLFDPEPLLCKAGDTDNCLTRAQVDAVKKIYAGPVDPVTGEQVHPGLEPGMEADSSTWRTWLLGGDQAKFGNSNFADVVYQGMPWDWRSSELHGDMVFAEQREAPYVNAADPDLRAFRKHGGKLLLFQGWGDSAVAPQGTIEYVEDVRKLMRAHGQGDLDGFMRLFMVPGMSHCWGGPGATSFGNEEVPLPGLVQDADHDIVMALDRWVTRGLPPNKLIATNTATAMTRPLCVYPNVARYGGGARNDAASFSCSRPPKPIP